MKNLGHPNRLAMCHTRESPAETSHPATKRTAGSANGSRVASPAVMHHTWTRMAEASIPGVVPGGTDGGGTGHADPDR